MRALIICITALLSGGCQTVPHGPQKDGGAIGPVGAKVYADEFRGLKPQEVCIVITTYPPQSECIKQ